MGVRYTSILAIGREFHSESEAKSFLDSYSLLPDDIDDYDCFDEGLPDYLDGGCLNMYSGDGYYVGYRIRCNSVEQFKQDFEDGVQKWESLFQGKQKAELIHTVRIS